MKGFIALLLFLMIGISAFNYWQIKTLREEVAQLEQKVNQQQNGGGVADVVVGKATAALLQAKEALAHTDMDKARAAFDSARKYLDEAARGANEKAGPAVKWLKDEASDLGRQIQDKAHGR